MLSETVPETHHVVILKKKKSTKSLISGCTFIVFELFECREQRKNIRCYFYYYYYFIVKLG